LGQNLLDLPYATPHRALCKQVAPHFEISDISVLGPRQRPKLGFRRTVKIDLVKLQIPRDHHSTPYKRKITHIAVWVILNT
jgi:hypothetical protein